MNLPPDVHFDFAVLLTGLTLLTGIGWLADTLWLAKRRRRLAAGGDKPGWLVDFSRSFFPVIFAVLILRSFLAEPFRIPSGSMIPTLLVGDFILVNKFSYGLRDPVFHAEFIKGDRPQRGHIVVFRYPHDPSVDYIKRIVGVPGDTIAYRDKTLYVNGEAQTQDADGVYNVPSFPGGTAYRYKENLNGREHHIIVNPNDPARDFEMTVPPGQYFAMGDNRDGSFDSRGWGTVPERNLVGRAFFIWMSWDSARMRPTLSRIFTPIH
ncbi:MAG: signal peptidase I [Panacagrimonas sp.]